MASARVAVSLFLLFLASPFAQAGFAFLNVSTIAHMSTGPGEPTMEYSFNLHLGVEGLDTTSPPFEQAAWAALRSADTVSEFDAVLANTPAADWWKARKAMEKQYIVDHVERMAGL